MFHFETYEKVDFFVRTQTPPLQGVFYDGQLWDARAFVDRLVKRAGKSLLLVDNFSRMPPRDSVAGGIRRFPRVRIFRVTSVAGSARLRPVSHTEHWSMPACRLPPKRYDGERGWIVDSKNPARKRALW